MKNPEERRKHYRLKLHLPIEVSSQDKDKRLSRITSNISAGGIYFSSPPNYTFAPGEKLNVKIVMPKTSAAKNHNLFDTYATVVRTEPITNSSIKRMGVACKFDRPLTFNV